MKHYYALTDSFTGDNPKEPTAGFAYTKEPLAFTSAAERREWLKTTKLTNAAAITRNEAIAIADWRIGRDCGCAAEFVKPCRIYGTGDKMYADYIILAESTI